MKSKLAVKMFATATVGWLLPSPTWAVIVGFEGESGTTPAGEVSYRVQDDPAALGGSYIDTDRRDAKAPFGDLAVFRDYPITLPAGTYDLWARIYCPRTFSYDPNFSDDPDSNDALAAFESDSFFVPFTLDGDPAVDQDRGNGFASSGRFDGSGSPPRANVHDNYAWINLTDGLDLNGLGPSSGSVDPVASYISNGDPVTFTLMSREGGIRHDAFAFVTDGQIPTEEELDAAVAASRVPDIIAFQGESGKTPAGKDAYRVQDDPDALGGSYIDTDHRDAKSPFGEFAVFREYAITLPAGTYDLWGRIYCPTTFSYNPTFSDDPDSNNALAAFENDSFFVPFTLDGDPAVDQDRGNGFASSGRFDGSGSPPRANVQDNYAWINLTDGVDLNGLGPSSGSVDPVASYTSTGDPVTFTLMSREGGIRHDAFAFVRDGMMPTEEQLDAAVPVLESFFVTRFEADFTAGTAVVTWDSKSGANYKIQRSTSLEPDDWQDLTALIPSEGSSTSHTVSIPKEAGKFLQKMYVRVIEAD